MVPYDLPLAAQPEGLGRLVVLGDDGVRVEPVQWLSGVLRSVLVLEVGPVAGELDAERTTGRTGEQHENTVGGEVVLAFGSHLAIEDGPPVSLLDGPLEKVAVERLTRARTALLLRLEDDARDGVVAAALDRHETKFELC